MSQPLKPESRRATFTESWGKMQYCDILDVENITDATAAGLLLQRYRYKIVSAQIAPLSRPFQREVKSCDHCRLVTQPPTSRIDFPGASNRIRMQNHADRCEQKKGKQP